MVSTEFSPLIVIIIIFVIIFITYNVSCWAAGMVAHLTISLIRDRDILTLHSLLSQTVPNFLEYPQIFLFIFTIILTTHVLSHFNHHIVIILFSTLPRFTNFFTIVSLYALLNLLHLTVGL